MIPSKPRTEREILLVQKPEEIHFYSSHSVFVPDLVIAIGFHLRMQPLNRCLASIINQDFQHLKVLVVIANDSKTDISDLLGKHQYFLNITILNVFAGKAARSRNILLDYIDRRFNRTVWIARLDADDELASSDALIRMIEQGERNRAQFVIAGNLLRSGGKIIGENKAKSSLKNPTELLKQLKNMGQGKASNELPSCNLLIKSHTGARYPHHNSAEDHWLLTELLIFKKEKVYIAEDIIYSIYDLDGNATNENQLFDRYFYSRQKLFKTATQWFAAIKCDKQLLGYGNEGIVYEDKGEVIKEFYDGVIDVETAAWLNNVKRTGAVFPKFKIYGKDDRWFCKYKMKKTHPFHPVSAEKLEKFLLKCLKMNLIPLNIKRDNLRIKQNGDIEYIDIGQDIRPLTASSFLDVSARLYSIGILDVPDSHIFRYKSLNSQDEELDKLPGFRNFYNKLIINHTDGLIEHNSEKRGEFGSSEVTLLIKCCAMDADFIREQLPHIIYGLEQPSNFFKKIVLIDSFEGPFLRAYADGNLTKVIAICEEYKAMGLINEIWLYPKSNELNQRINVSWFNCPSNKSHTIKQVPVASQLWAFENIETRYVLQCDSDVLIGRRDYSNDYLKEMLTALKKDEKALSCGFNIPKNPSSSFESYKSPQGAYVPEVRLGLLDLQRIKCHRPFPNSIDSGKLSLSWYRSIELFQKKNGWKSLRGGNPLTFYIHPPNYIKKDHSFIRLARQLCEMGQVPESQFLKWDLEYQVDDWELPNRHEDVVFLIKGRNISLRKISRCFASLRIQDDQDFGLVVIDDCSDDSIFRHFSSMLGSLQQRTTLIKRKSRVGRIRNFITGIKQVCQNAESLIVILDMDDALINIGAVSLLKQKLKEGHDLIQAGVYRPDKPLKQYSPEYSVNIRKEYGNDTWSHLRSFKKRLFDAIPEDYFKINGQWVNECTDYATMIPLVELAKKPVYIDQYLYLHERSNLHPDKKRKSELIQGIVDKESLVR